ncbi:MAG: hypothetical protein EBZ76_13785 [Synechococcaceae bacterium WB9_2_170]|nr:hypothetical protein [Synechococcaceae bacterium WB9_2_170]
MRPRPGLPRQDHRLRGGHRGPCHQGWPAGRTPAARTSGRRRAVLRGRSASRPPSGPGHQEPVRKHLRGGAVRDDWLRPSAGRREPVGGRPQPGPKARFGGGSRPGRLPMPAGRGSSPDHHRHPGGCQTQGQRTGCQPPGHASGGSGTAWGPSAGRSLEPGTDLAVALAVAAARMGRTPPAAFAAVGEVGLTGQIRPCSHLEQRVAAAARRGVKYLALPAGQVPPRVSGLKVELWPVAHISQALEFLNPAKSGAKPNSGRKVGSSTI